MKILIIGNKGFIGSHAQSYFERQGFEVFGCDVVTDYVSQHYFQIDASNSDFRDVFAHTEYDACINCSGAASVPASLQDPLRDYMLNTVNVFNILDSIRRLQLGCKFLNLSSAAVYGNPKYLPIDEEHPLNPISPYGLHKLQAEQICAEFSSTWQIKTCNVRIFSAYGPGLFKQLFWDLSRKAQFATKIELFGTGDETRDFIYIDDIVEALYLIIESGDFRAGIYNLASGNEIRIADAVQVFYSLYKPKLNVSFAGVNRSGDPLNWCASIAKMVNLGFSPKIDIETGLICYVRWLRDLK